MLLAQDGSARDRERLLRLADEQEVPAHTLAVESARLGEWLGRGKVAVVGISDPNLAAAIAGTAGSARREPGPARGPLKRGGR